uniref:Transmembrane protein 135 N-terminal domain-containing protein n=1 Tax=Plectus sambesii TaxID=2011161 RepID=A0A914VGG1_9BILA
MTVMSKFFAGQLGMQLLTTNCYETTHPWNPSCWGALYDVVWNGWKFSFKTYLTVYFLTSLAHVKDPRKIDWKRLVKDAARSAAFLTANLVGYLFWMCRFRQAFGFFVWPSLGLFNGFAASFFAILLEQKKRRGMLTLYLTNLASETAFRMLVNHGYLKKLPHGESMVLGTGLAGYFYLLHNRQLDEGAAKVLGLVFKLQPDDILPLHPFPREVQQLLIQLRAYGGKHHLCIHKNSCLSTSVESFLRNFTVGYGVSAAMHLVKSLGQIFKKPSAVLSGLVSFQTLRLPLFLGSLPLIYHASQCLLHRHFDRSDALFGALSGALSGAAMMFYPNVSIAMYVLWKWIETIYFKAVSSGYLPSWKHGDILLYTISTGFVLFSASMEPHSIRKGYWNFLLGLTGNKAALFNRVLFDKFGFNSSRWFPGYRPALDPCFCTMNPGSY